MPCCGKKKKSDELERILSLLGVSPETMSEVSDRFNDAMTRGMKALEDYDVRMFPTYINAVPNSNEKGRFLSMDLGISRLVISLVELRGKHISFKRSVGGNQSPDDPETTPGSLPPNMRWSSNGIKSRKKPIAYESLQIDLPDDIKTMDGENLFQYLVDRLKDFLALSSRIPPGNMSLGFNFPCPCRKTGPGNGVLTNWTKDYACEGVLGEDVATLLQDAFDRNGLPHIRVEVLLNDTLATLLAGSYGPSTATVLVGVTLGTATDAVFQERLERIPETTFHAENMECYKTNVDKTMIIDTEWGAFGESTGDLDEMRTEFDLIVDETSKNPGRDVFAKMTCGMYTGEIVRLILISLHQHGRFLPDREAPLWNDSNRWKLTHMHMASIESDRGITFSSTKKVLSEFGLPNVDNVSCRVVKRVCEAVSVRSARLAGAGLAAIVKRIARESVTIAIDGSLLRCHPTYRRRLEESIDTVLKMRPSALVRRQVFSLKLISDGAIIGAGIGAACYTRDNYENQPTWRWTMSKSRPSRQQSETRVLSPVPFNVLRVLSKTN